MSFMEPIHVSDIFEKQPARASVRGWVYRKRSSGGVLFVLIRDSTGVIQVAVKKDVAGERAFADADKALIESSVRASGLVKKDERAPGGVELQATDFEVIHFAHPFPITEHQSTKLLLDKRHLWLRSQHLTNVMKARALVIKFLREFFNERGFYEVAPPIITKNQCEGGSTLFSFNYFGEKAFLSQSAQLYNEAFITSLEKVFVLAPSFRAEKSRTTKHLAEYWHLEEEAAWFDNEDNMRLQEEMVSFVCQRLADEPILKNFARKPSELKAVKPPFPRLSYREAVERVRARGSKMRFGEDFGAEDERLLVEGEVKPVFVFNWPKHLKPFYMELASDGEHVLNNDLFAPEGHGEIIGGSQRIWEYDKLVARLKEEKLDAKTYAWYLDLRKYGSVPHSGFGLGIERFMKWLLNLKHIRDAIPFPRVINRAYP